MKLVADALGLFRQKAAGSTTALGTTTTAVTGLTLALPAAGTYEFKMWVPLVNVLAPTDTQCTVSPSGGPTATMLFYTISRYSATAGTATVHTAFNTATTGAVASCIMILVSGVITLSGAGSITLNATRTGGTSQTVQATAYVSALRVA